MFLAGVAVSLSVPLYHLAYIIKKQLMRLYGPAKSRVMATVANRYVVHVVVGLMVLVTGVLNVQTDEVRAESFGQRSLLYELVTQQDELIEEYAQDDVIVEVSRVSYRDTMGLSSITRGVDFIGSESNAVSLLGNISTTPVASEEASSAPRNEVVSYIVESGDTLSSIANAFGISLNTLLWANDLSVSSTLSIGDSLAILPVDGVAHTVSSGDTLSSIAQKYDVEQDAIIDYNALGDSSTLAIGDELLVPGGEVQAATRTTSTSISRIFTSPSTTTTSSSTTITSPSVTGSGSMVWPTDLYTITQYYGWRHTGLDIDCGYTHDNYAADAGYVQFSGWDGGYGYSIEINHGNGIVTRYGHHASMYVTAGQYVSKGQAIGRCGTTGRSTGTHLHFEVIVNGSFRNPLEYIR